MGIEMNQDRESGPERWLIFPSIYIPAFSANFGGLVIIMHAALCETLFSPRDVLQLKDEVGSIGRLTSTCKNENIMVVCLTVDQCNPRLFIAIFYA